MPRRDLVYFKAHDCSVPLVEWLDALQEGARAQCFVRIERLEKLGHELRRPEAENLGRGIFELRMKHRGVNYRILYFFHGTSVVVVSHGFSKQQARVPAGEIRLATRRKLAFESNPLKHSFRGGN